jgi:hypothetical protein
VNLNSRRGTPRTSPRRLKSLGRSPMSLCSHEHGQR